MEGNCFVDDDCGRREGIADLAAAAAAAAVDDDDEDFAVLLADSSVFVDQDTIVDDMSSCLHFVGCEKI